MDLALLLNFLLGLSLGALGGLLGIGGGLIAIPVLGYLHGMDQHLAQGTALIMIAPNVLLGFWRYRQRNRFPLRPVVWMGAFSMLFTYVAAKFAFLIDPSHLHIAFACFLLALAAFFASQPLSRAPSSYAESTGGKPAPDFESSRALPLLGMISGAMSGIFTVGAGLVVVPALVSFFRMTQTKAQGIALALVVPGALVALFAYARAGHVDWNIGVPLALGGMLSISWGVALAHRLPPRRLRTAFCIALAATALMMLLAR